jgi:hypothetical protein
MPCSSLCLTLRPPEYTSFADYMARTTNTERMRRCYQASKRANRVHRPLTPALISPRLTGPGVWGLIETAKGRCMYCRSLAVEQKPAIDGRRNLWADVGRRIGSLEHVDPYLRDGQNDLSNLGWACLWCNVWPDQRVPLAADHGGYYPDEPDIEASATC